MNRLLLVLLAVGVGAIGFRALERAAERTRTATAVEEQTCKAGTNRLAQTQEMLAALRGDVLDKRNRLRQAMRRPNISPELLHLVEGDASRGQAAAWAELRQQLGIGWDSSPDYVLVSKRVLKGLEYQRLLSVSRPTDEACELLALSPDEQSALKSVLQHARDAAWLRLQRTEPSGDIVAQYTVPAPDPVFQQSLSNNFAAELASAVGPERADLLLPNAWRELRSDLTPAETETMTIRQSVVDGEPDLVCEMKRGNTVSTEPVRYGHYPNGWLSTLFPRGWEGLAQQEGFELPARFWPGQ